MAIQFEQTCPIFRIFDIEKAREHRFAEGMPLYMQVSRGALVLHLSEHHGDGSPGANIFVRMQGVEELHKEVNARGYRFMRGGSVCLNSFDRLVKWISASIMPPPSSVPAR
ncbi:glyoxalase superfamily protein [Brucella anthropi]|uniref:glyoxalase superfamily protein n=1 Tax=Brucella anthropi TaxID=529 RepID=UPI00384D3635